MNFIFLIQLIRASRGNKQNHFFFQDLAPSENKLRGVTYSSNFAGIVIGDWCRYFGYIPPHVWYMATFLSSSDSGKTWDPPPKEWFPPGPDLPEQLLAVQSMDSLNFILAGSFSYIAKLVIYRNKGSYDISSVTPIKSFNKYKYDTLFEDIHFFNLNRGFVIGEHGIIFYTENSGRGWSRIPSLNSTTLLRITFIDSARGWIVGANGVILHTDNGGWIGGTSEVQETQKQNIEGNALTYNLNDGQWILRTQDHFTRAPVASIFSLLGVQVLENIQCNELSDKVYSVSIAKLPAGFYIARFLCGNRTFALPLVQR